MGVETIDYGGTKYAEVIRADERVSHTTFFSPPESSFQFGLLAHPAGFVEAPHYHAALDDEHLLEIGDGPGGGGVVAVLLYDDSGGFLLEVVLRPGDAIVLIHGVHAIRVIEDMQCISVKQGPFLGTELDKVTVAVKDP
jgi:hypothetical protein